MSRATAHPKRTRSLILVIAIAAFTLVVSACGSSASSGSAKTASGMIQIKAGVVPAMPAAAVYVGLQKNIFAQHGVDLDAEPAQTGASVLASLLNGEMQVGYISTTVAISAIERGAPIRFAAGGDVVPANVNQHMYGGLVFAKGKAITNYSQLQGMTVAVNALQGVDNLTLDAAVASAGGDPDKVKVVEVPYPEQWSAVSSGRVNAAIMTDPFYSQAMAEGGSTYGNINAELGANASVSSYVVSDAYAQSHPEAVSRFVAAMDAASAASNADPSLVRQVIPQFSKVSVADAQRVTLPTFSGALNASSIQPVINLMLKFGYITKPLNAQQVLAQD